MNATMTQTETKTYTGAQDVREVFVSFNEDICAVLHDVAQATQEFDLQQVQQDCAILALYDAISEIRLQIYVGDEIIREYSYKITDSGENSGAPAGQPPLGYTHVAGARVRLIALANPRRPKEYCQRCFETVKWVDAKPLRDPEDAIRELYGTFASGQFGMERRVMVNPKFDRALEFTLPLTQEKPS